MALATTPATGRGHAECIVALGNDLPAFDPAAVEAMVFEPPAPVH